MYAKRIESAVCKKGEIGMNAIEIRNLSKSFRGMYALNGLNMTVPVGAIYGFIGGVAIF